MANLVNVNNVLQIPANGLVGDVLTRKSAAEVGWSTPAGGIGGGGTAGTVAVFTAAGTIGNNLAGSDVTFSVPNGQVGVFAINGVSLVRFTSAGFSPTVNGGVASGDAAHVWANVYGRSISSDVDLFCDAGTAGSTVHLSLAGVTVFGVVAAGLMPSANNTYAIGSAALVCSDVFTRRVDSDDNLALNAVTGKVVNLQVNASTVLQIAASATTWKWPTTDAVGVVKSDGAGNLSISAQAASFPYPFQAPASPNANNDEFDGTLAAWTVLTALASGNTDDVNANVNSRLVIHIGTATNDTLLLTKTLSGVWTNDISVTVAASPGKFVGSFVGIDFGFLAAGLNSGFVVRVATATGLVVLNNFSNWTTNTSAALITPANTFDTAKSVEPYGYYHLQRVGGTWSIWVSNDAASWVRLGTDGTALAVVGGALGLRGFGSTAPYTAAVDWIRYNWLFLP